MCVIAVSCQFADSVRVIASWYEMSCCSNDYYSNNLYVINCCSYYATKCCTLLNIQKKVSSLYAL